MFRWILLERSWPSYEDNRATDLSHVTGQAGPKAFGRHAKAEMGDQLQNQGESIPREQLTPLLDSMKELIASSKAPPDAQAIARSHADEILAAAESPAKNAEARSAWKSLQQWVGGALTVGLFAADSAEKIKKLVERISALF